MYKTKSKNIVAMAQKLCSDFGGEVPDDYDALISLPGVGRKTANVVLSVGFGQPRIAVDTHVFRVANRIGLVHEKDVLKTELALMEKIPEERWSRTHHSLIFMADSAATRANRNATSVRFTPIVNTLTDRKRRARHTSKRRQAK